MDAFLKDFLGQLSRLALRSPGGVWGGARGWPQAAPAPTPLSLGPFLDGRIGVLHTQPHGQWGQPPRQGESPSPL